MLIASRKFDLSVTPQQIRWIRPRRNIFRHREDSFESSVIVVLLPFRSTDRASLIIIKVIAGVLRTVEKKLNRELVPHFQWFIRYWVIMLEHLTWMNQVVEWQGSRRRQRRTTRWLQYSVRRRVPSALLSPEVGNVDSTLQTPGPTERITIVQIFRDLISKRLQMFQKMNRPFVCSSLL